MAKFSGAIGFSIPENKGYGVYQPKIVTKPCRGDVISNFRKWESSDKVNDDLLLNNKFSIVAKSFFVENLGSMKFVEWKGIRWKITNAEILRPRIIVTVGGVYNGISS